jgi:hypothetical protein
MRTGNAFDFAPPPPGIGPRSLVNVSGNDLVPIGNIDSPILKPWAAAEVEKHNQLIRSGKLALDAPASCVPMGVPYVLQVRENVWLLHYEGDTLVVDTTGIAVHEFSAIDRFGTPHSEAMRVVERFRVADDRRSLRVDFTVDDPGTFNMPWHAAVVYTPGTAYPGERPCAENNREGEAGLVPMPVASKPDF